MANAMLPNIGNRVNYDLIPENGTLNELKRGFDQLNANYDIYKRIQSGQIGPEAEQLLQQFGPNAIKKALKKNKLKLNINYMNPYIGFKYDF